MVSRRVPSSPWSLPSLASIEVVRIFGTLPPPTRRVGAGSKFDQHIIMKSPSCYCFGYGEVEDASVAKLMRLIEVVSGRQPRRSKARVYVLKPTGGRNPHQHWAEENLLDLGDAEGSRYKLCASGRMRSAVRVKGNVGLMRSLVETELTDCATKEGFVEHLEKVKMGVFHEYIKDGHVFNLVERGHESLLADESKNKFAISCRVVRLVMCEEAEGMVVEEEAFHGKWLVELTAKAQGADYQQAVVHFETLARKLEPLCSIRAPP